MNILLTGEKQLGKTTVCKGLIKLMRARNLNPTGLLTPAVYDDQGKKSGFNALNIDTGELWHLATTRKELDGPRVGMYSFDQHALELALEVLRSACNFPKDLLILDEIGPLELKKNRGFAPILNLLPLSSSEHLLLVVRTASLAELQERLASAIFEVVEATLANRDALPQQLITKLWG